ncbi:phage tail sheath protein FI [Sedimentibacter acidaminivorans]|uniref:Phage tail sheath protein FI n=1 Tax=Sedimentibacter acidaminivorans TaxID=913099 RepID=A0ABS4GA75_9FIRM|nr:phage tail sheath family protein [Sedimentibacter acidaminivorans]MBP1924593.1 phage tail sheath protein FI [Sedimentibacter acidaminivorans]
MSYQHGIYIQENPTSIIPPVTSDSGVQVIVGTAPINLSKDLQGAVNKPIIAYSWAEAIENLGYSDDWENYTLCEAMDASFRRIGVAPVIFINVLDPEVHKVADTETLTLTDEEGTLDAFGIILSSVVVKDSEGVTTYTKDVDYTAAFNSDGYLVISIIDGGLIPIETAGLKIEFNKLDPSLVDDEDIIGGYDVVTGKYTGLELIGQVYPRLGIVPGLILTPGYSHKPGVASVIDVKSESINGSFNCMNVLDIDSTTVKSYQDAPTWKNTNAYTSKRTILCWPKVKIGDKVYWFSSIIAALTAYTDAQNDNVPYVSPSNKTLPITATVLADNSEVYLDQLQANFLNSAGIMTAINVNGWRAWGNNTAAYPGTTDPKDRFIPIRRVFDWWGNTFILTYFQKVDDPSSYRLIESIVDSENIRGNGFQARGQIAGAKIEFRQEDNPITNILNGQIQFIQKIAAFPPAENIVNVLEFDPSMLQSALYGGE